MLLVGSSRFNGNWTLAEKLDVVHLGFIARLQRRGSYGLQAVGQLAPNPHANHGVREVAIVEEWIDDGIRIDEI